MSSSENIETPSNTAARRRRSGLLLAATCIAFVAGVKVATTGKVDLTTESSSAVATASRRLSSLTNYAFDNDEEDERTDPIHIVYASDFHSIAGVEASIRSVKAHASEPHRVKFYFIGDDPLPNMADQVQFINLTAAAIKYDVEEFTNPNYVRKGKHEREEGVKINTNAANYVRFVMDKLLPKEAKKAFWIDSDTIVRCDVVQLVENTLVSSDYVIAAVPVPGPPLGIFPDHRPTYADIRWTFNAGVYMVDLEKWKKQKMEKVMRDFTQKNREEFIYKFGSQPPLTLTFKEDFEHLPTNWNVKVEKAEEDAVEDACLLHWAGANKPWNGAGKYVEIWQAYENLDVSIEDMQ